MTRKLPISQERSFRELQPQLQPHPQLHVRFQFRSQCDASHSPWFHPAKSPKGRSRSLSVKSVKSHKKSKSKEHSPPPLPSTGISTSVISSPTPDSFKHIAHIGFNRTNGVIETSQNLDPSFQEILAELQVQTGSTVTESVVLEHLDFVQGFWKDVGSVQRSASNRPLAAN